MYIYIYRSFVINSSLSKQYFKNDNINAYQNSWSAMILHVVKLIVPLRKSSFIFFGKSYGPVAHKRVKSTRLFVLYFVKISKTTTLELCYKSF